MRPIDADTLLKRPIWFCGGWMGDSYAEGYMDALDKVEEVIKSEPTIEMPRWIPCKERLPKVGEEVLCQCRANIIEVLYLDKFGFWENPSSFRHFLNSFVIAWMPLPESYTEERKDNETD